MEGNPFIPMHIEKSLFAEDLVRYVMLLHTSVDDLPDASESYRWVAYNGFNNTMRRAVLFLSNERIRVLKDTSVARNSTDMKLVSSEQHMRQQYFPNGFDVNSFFPYCVHVIILAAYFYKEGVSRAPYLAVMFIEQVLEQFDVSNGGWDTLNKIAEKYANLL